jgi:ATP synthase F1 delta subunit
MAKHDKVAVRYAKAIFDHLNDVSKTRLMVDELKKFSDCFEISKELENLLTRNVATLEERRGVITDLSTRLQLSEVSLKILLFLSASKRLKETKAISEKLHYLLLVNSNVVPIHVEAAAELSNEEKAKIERKFETLLGKGVEASYQIDSRLIAGVKVIAAGKTYDGSVAGWLSTFKEQLVGGQI